MTNTKQVNAENGTNTSELVAVGENTRSHPNAEYVLYERGEPIAGNADGDTSSISHQPSLVYA